MTFSANWFYIYIHSIHFPIFNIQNLIFNYNQNTEIFVLSEINNKI